MSAGSNDHIVIIGNGISGVTLARFVRKNSDCKITIISSETEYFFSRTALMYIYMGHMRLKDTQPYENDFWEKNKIDLKFDHVTDINFENKQLNFETSSSMKYDSLVLAVGSKPNKFGWPGQDLPGVQGLYSYKDLELLEENTKNGINRSVIIGGGLIGIELAEMLHTRNYPVTFLVREGAFWGGVLPEPQAKMIERHMTTDYHIDLQLNTELAEIHAGSNGRVSKITTKSGEKIDCQLVGLTAGVSPNIDFLKNTSLKTDKGILVNEYLETSIKDVYAIGDCAEFKEHPTGRRNLEQVWYTGKMMGETLAYTLTGAKTAYKPGNWFNSAKFFDIEYQTYGWVFAKPQENESVFYWEHPTKYLSLYFVFNTKTHEFKGINTFGIRLRHELFDRWLTDKMSIEYVLEHLKDANFDPELYSQYEKQIVQQFNSENNTSIKPKKKSWKRIFNLSQK